MSVKLDRSRIVTAALHIIDREGLDRLTMRRLGSRLGCTAMAVYSHYPNRDAVLHAAAEEVWREALVDVDLSSSDPVEVAVAAAVSIRRAFRRHGDIALVGIPRTEPGVAGSTQQNISRAMGRMFAVDRDRADQISYSLMTFTVGAAMLEAQRRRGALHQRGSTAVLEKLPAVEHLVSDPTEPSDPAADTPLLGDDLADGRFASALRTLLSGILESARSVPPHP